MDDRPEIRVRIDNEIKLRIQVAADRERRSLSAQVEILLIEAMEARGKS